MSQTTRHLGSDRGAVLVHVAVAMIGLMAFSTFVVDYGVLWSARRQAQNAADAAAMSGAAAFAFDEPYNQNPLAAGKAAAFRVSQRNPVWGEVPSVVPATDITFPAGPDCHVLLDSPFQLYDCIRVDVHRNAGRNNPLPIFFGQLVGLSGQGVRATATARMYPANTVRCLKPWAIPDAFDVPLTSYLPPNASSPRDSQYTLYFALGSDLVLHGALPATVAPGSLHTLDLGGAGSAASYQANIGGCSATPVGLGDALTPDVDDMQIQTLDGVNALIALDAGATWNTGTKRIENSCASDGTCPPYTLSPRLVALAVFDPKVYTDSGELRIVNLLGFFIKHMNGADIEGAITTIPGTFETSRPGMAREAAFVKTLALVR
jgi:hypothetical protein